MDCRQPAARFEGCYRYSYCLELLFDVTSKLREGKGCKDSALADDILRAIAGLAPRNPAVRMQYVAQCVCRIWLGTCSQAQVTEICLSLEVRFESGQECIELLKFRCCLAVGEREADAWQLIGRRQSKIEREIR